MADDFAGLKSSIHDFLDAVPLDAKGLTYNHDALALLLRQLTVIFRAKCVANGVTGI